MSSSINREALSKNLEDIIKSSKESLSSTFSYDEENSSLTEQEQQERLASGDSRFAELFGQSYLDVLDKYKGLGSQLSNLRSTFLPISMIRNVIDDVGGLATGAYSGQSAESVQIEDISAKKFLIESFENTFMRALGMPSENAVDEFIYFNYPLSEFEGSVDLTKLRNILNERQISDIRQVELNNEIFEVTKDNLDDFYDKDEQISDEGSSVIDSISNSGDVDRFSLEGALLNSSDFPEKDKTTLIRILDTDKDFGQNLFFYYTGQEDLIVADISLENLSESIFKKSYLLFPPVQDSSIEKCISEPEKFIMKPFSQRTNLKYNGQDPKISLLEAVIRIRLDKLSGYDPSVVLPLEEFTSQRILNINDVIGEQTYSFVENLTIDRLSFSLSQLAVKLSDEIEDYFINTDFVRSQVKLNKADNNPDSNNPENKKSVGQKTTNNTEIGGSLEVQEEVYALIKNIDEVFKLLLSDDKAINIQSDTFRTSSVSKGQFMGIINELVTTPGNVVRKQEIEENDEKEIKKGATIDKNAAEIATILGIGRGVGLVDLICFAIAMFSLEERFLIGMLDENQFNNLKKEYPVFGFFDGFIKPSITSSLEEYTKNVIGAYEFFIENLENEENPSAT